MKIVFVNRFCHPDHSATSQMVSDLGAGLSSRGMNVTIIACRHGYDDLAARLPALESWQGVEIRRIWTSRFGRTNLLGRAADYLTFYLSLPWVLWRILRPGDVVVAKTDPPLVSCVVAPIAWCRSAVLVNWLQDIFPEVAISLARPRIPRALAWLFRRLRDNSLRMAAVNVVIGSRMSEYLVAEGLSARRVRVIPNWALEESIRPMPVEESRLRQSLGWAGRFVVGYSGNMGRAHDTETLFHAAKRLRAETGIGFLIIGGGHGYAHLQQCCESEALENIRFLPYQPFAELTSSMAAADLHLLSLLPALEGRIVPSKFYGIAAASRPMGFIGDRDGEVARLIREAECGFSIEPGQDDLLAAAILRMAASPDRGQEQGRRARRFLDEKFSRDSAHRQWHILLAGLGAGPESKELREEKR